MKTKIGKYLNEEDEFQAFEVERKEKKGLVAQLARGISKSMGSSKLYKVIKKDSSGDRQVIGLVAANSEKDAINKAKKI